ncbi:MAG TPA: YceI family protein [Cellvibrionaceae bacterium]
MKVLAKYSLLPLLLLLGSCAQLVMPKADRELAQLPAGNYRLAPAHTTVIFKIGHLGISSYVGRFNQTDASLQYDSENPEKSRLTATVAMSSLDVNDTDFSETLTGCDWLCAEKYPEAVFTTIADAEVQGNKLTFPGELRFRGVTREAEIVVDMRGGADNMLTGRYTLGFDAHLTFNRSKYGMGKYIPVVGDRVDIEVYTEFLREKE